jgi:proteasome assembly chaperone (PAC2) family protein
MENRTEKPNPWLIAAWPGMGNVAMIAAGYLVHRLRMKETAELPSRNHFDVNEVQVKGGVIAPVRPPRGVFFRWSNPHGGRDLIVFLGEDQPANGTYAYAHELLEMASTMGAERVVTFASMASCLHPSENPKVMGITTDAGTLADLQRAEVEPLTDGQIGGLNGVLLGAAAVRGLSGMCLLAEIPFFAAAVPNPKAARAALSVFSVLAGIDVSLQGLNKHAAMIDRALIEALDKMEQQRRAREEHGDFESEPDEPDEDPESEAPAEPEPKEPAPAASEPDLDFAARSRIERLFSEAREDPDRAVALKQELDRLGVFKRYEDRFLDLFRRAA